MDYIEFENKKYPLKTLDFPFGERIVSIGELNRALMNKEGNDYVSENARYVDEQIFYFVEKESLNLSDNELVLKILSEI